jgi:glycosyltransferase involved in cell wall biosynthesis
MKEFVTTNNLSSDVEFKKGIPNKSTVDVYNSHKIFVNLSPSGLYDKTMFEAMACESLILVSNRDLAKLVWSDFIFNEDDVEDLVNKLEKLLALTNEVTGKKGVELRKNVAAHHSLDGLMNKLASVIKAQ